MKIEQLNQICEFAGIQFPETDLIEGMHIFTEPWDGGTIPHAFYHLFDEDHRLLDIQTSRKIYVPRGNFRPRATSEAIQGPKKLGRVESIPDEPKKTTKKKVVETKSSKVVTRRKHTAKKKTKKTVAVKKQKDFDAFQVEHQTNMEALRQRVNAFVASKNAQ